jgi:hypothetical protein
MPLLIFHECVPRMCLIILAYLSQMCAHVCVPYCPCLSFINVCHVCALLSLLVVRKCVPTYICLIVLACRLKMCAHVCVPYCPCLSLKNVCPRVCALLSLLVVQKCVPTHPHPPPGLGCTPCLPLRACRSRASIWRQTLASKQQFWKR